MSKVNLMLILALACTNPLFAASGDPQLQTDHPWYPGERSCSSFERLFKTQTALYKRITGRDTATDEDKVLAAWYWRNLNYFHAEEGCMNYWGTGADKGGKNQEYWTGLFAHGMGLCGTTHAQWVAEIDTLLGPSRSRVTGVDGHNSFEVWLTGGAYGQGQWALLDHDVSTVIFHEDGSRLLSIPEIQKELDKYKNPAFKPERQKGWRVCGLHDSDAGTYARFGSAEYRAGYAGPPPMFHLRAGESLRRYLKPGLDDGKTFVYWGMNYLTNGIPGPERWGTWVNQPEAMYKAAKTAGYKPGQARFANAVYTYAPDFKNGSYKEGVIDESDRHVTFEFTTPFVIACTPAENVKGWVIYKPGAKNGLVLKGAAACGVKVSTDHGKTWADGGAFADGMDLTDHVKGYQQYWLKFEAGVKDLAASNLVIRTVCQCNGALIPRLKDGGAKITFASSGQAVFSAGPTLAQAGAHIVEGAQGTKAVTLELAAPRGEKPVRIHAAGWQASSNPPAPAKYFIEASTDGGKNWLPVVKDWEITRRAPDPADFWSQSISWGEADLKDTAGPVRVRFGNNGGKNYRRVEAHLVYELARPGGTEVTFAWKEGTGPLKTATHVFPHTAGKEDTSWTVATGANVETVWVEYKAKE